MVQNQIKVYLMQVIFVSLLYISNVIFGIGITMVSADLTELQKQQILQVFNQARSTTVVPAANMKMLSWDETIARVMQNYTNGCTTVWKVFKNPPMYFAYRDHAKDPVGVAAWRTLRMAPYYDINTGGCINTTQSHKICEHPEIYERLIVADIERVGCGVTRCGSGPKGVFHACAIASVKIPPTSDHTRYPFIRATSNDQRCSKCPVGWQGGCKQGLCTKDN
jgi:hypothetical protein